MKRDTTNYDLICPFLDDDPRFAHGFEFGKLFQTMKTEDKISGYFMTDNQEQITLLCNRTGWTVVSMEPWAEHPDQWIWIEMEKN